MRTEPAPRREAQALSSLSVSPQNALTKLTAWIARHPLWSLFGLALAVRILPATFRFVISTDEGLFLTLGQNLAAGLGYTSDGRTLQVDFPPGYPLVAAVIYGFGGGLELPSKINLLAFGSLLPLPVFWLARQLGDEKTAFRSGLFTALLPGLALGQVNFEASAEQLYSLLLYTGWAALGWGVTRRRALAFGLAGLAVGAAHLVRWEGLILGLLGAGVIALTLRRALLLPTLLFWSGLGLFAVPYGLFLYQHTGSFVSPKTTITQLHGAALDANASDPYALEKAYEVYEAYLADPTIRPSPATENRAALLRRYLGNVLLELRLWLTSVSLMTIVWLVPAAIGLWVIERKRALFLVLLFIPLAAIPASVVDPRYFLPTLPAALIFAAYGWAWLGERLPTLHLAERLASRPVPLVSTLVAATLAVFIVGDLAGPFLYPRPTEYRLAGLTLRGQLPQGAHMLARKRQVAFYAGATWEWLPFADLEGVLEYADSHAADYLVIDEFTTPALRPQLAYLLDPANAPPGLKPVYYDETGGVVVYQINP